MVEKIEFDKKDIEYLKKLSFLNINTTENEIKIKKDILRHLGALNTILMLHTNNAQDTKKKNNWK